MNISSVWLSLRLLHVQMIKLFSFFFKNKQVYETYLGILSRAWKPTMNSLLVLINTVCLLFFSRKLPWSHLNKPARSIWSHLKVVIGTSLRWRERESKRGAEQVRRRRLQIGDATCYMLQGDEVQISALKEYVPRGHVWDLRLFLSFSPPPHTHTLVFKILTWCNKRQFEIFSAPYTPPHPTRKNIQDLSLQVKNVYANAGYIRACTGC